jgi:uncharacterized membrane protein YccC
MIWSLVMGLSLIAVCGLIGIALGLLLSKLLCWLWRKYELRRRQNPP